MTRSNRGKGAQGGSEDRVRSALEGSTSAKDRERIDRFESCYNRLDREFEKMTRGDRSGQHRTWATKVRIASSNHRRLNRFKDFLLEIGELRNAMVHNRTGDDLYMAVPSHATVIELERIETLILQPRTVIPTFAAKVETFAPDDTLATVLARIAANGRSRFPVYDHREGFIGLLTTNGLTRWAANELEGTMINVDASTITVEEILAFDHRRDNVIFVARTAMVDDVDEIFAQKRSLEAAIITERGRMTEQPLGLICPKDLVRA